MTQNVNAPKSIWIIFEGSGQPRAVWLETAAIANKIADELDKGCPSAGPHRAVRFARIDEAEDRALRRVLCLARCANPNESEQRAIELVDALLERGAAR